MFAHKAHEAAREFAAQNFAPCRAHQTEAIAVHEALQRLCETELPALEPPKLVREILQAPARLPAFVFHTRFETHSLDRLELAMAIEEEQGAMSDSEMDSFLNDLTRTQQVFDTLLGYVAGASTWDPATIWFRSIGSIVNERARHREGCSCV
jgi:hypothetical protein